MYRKNIFFVSTVFCLVLPAATLQITNVQGSDGLHAIQTSGSGGTIVQYTTSSQDGQQFFVPGEWSM